MRRFMNKWGRAATVLVIAVAAVGTPATGEDALPDGVRSGQGSNVDRLPPDAARMYTIVKKPHPGELKWQQIPWLLDLEQGIRLAEEEKRPLLIFVSGDDPLEKC